MLRTFRAAFYTFAIAIVGMAQCANASITVDGSFLAGEWAGANLAVVNYDPGAPLGNFGSPGNTNHVVGYNILTTGDANYFYVGLQATSNGATGLAFANLYFDLSAPANGSDLGFEIFNNNAFIPGVPGSASTVGLGIQQAAIDGTASTAAAIEVAIPWSIFTSDSIPGITYTPATSQVQLRLSQSLGYSVAGGSTYGADRLGTLAVPGAVPEASSLVTFGVLAIAATCAATYRKRMKA